MSDEFFIGWQGKVPEQTGRFLKRGVIAALLVVAALAAALPALQRTVSEDARFEFGNVEEFKGILVKDPVPILVSEDDTVYFLVSPFKFGFEQQLADQYHLKSVSLKGTRIHRGDQQMIEVLPESLESAVSSPGGPPSTHPLGSLDELGEITLRGEIVDSKCYLGVMNPGNLKPHRACAVNCIEGGIPPVLLVRDESGQASCVLLVKEDGSPLNAEILALVAEPVRVTGRLKRQGKLLVLFADRDRFSLEEG